MKNLTFITLTGLLALTALSARATVLLSDDFSDGSLDGWTATDNDAASGTLDIVDASSNGLDGNAMRMQTDDVFQGPAIFLSSTQTLANTGDEMSLSFDFVITDIASNTGFFRFGLVDDANGDFSDGLEGDAYFGQISSSATDRGRIVASNSGLTYADAFQIKEENDIGWQLAANTVYSASLTLTRTGTGEVTGVATFSGSANDVVLATSDFTVDYTTFDAIGFAINDSSSTILFDNIELAAIPEPSSLVMIALAAAAGFLGLRRRRA